jgi:hypothetical protein
MMHTPWAAALIGFLINLPFGYWRAASRRLSFAWFAAIHVPVMLTIALRFLLGVPFQLRTLPLYAAAFFGGQFLGGRIRLRPRAAPPLKNP